MAGKDKRTSQLYNVMQSVEARLGGGEGIEGIYGSITATGMQKVLDCLHHSCGLDCSSALVDIGAGLCRPLLHALVSHGVCRTYGVELDRVKVDKAGAFTQQTLQQLQLRGVDVPGGMSSEPILTCAAIEQVASLDPATHAYSFWEGVPRIGKAAFGRLFRASKSLKAVAVVQRAIRQQDPCIEMRQLGFGPLLLIKSFKVSMSGSGRSFTAYVFSKVAPPAAAFLEGRMLGSTAAKQANQQHHAAHDEGGSESESDFEQEGGGGLLVALCTARVAFSPIKRSNAADCDVSPTKKHKGGEDTQQEQPMQPQQPGRPYRLRPTRLSYAQQASSSVQNSSASSAAPGKENEPDAQRPARCRSTRASTAAASISLLPGSKLTAAAPVLCTSTPANEPEGTACVQRGDSVASEATAVAAAQWSHKVQQAVITQAFSRQAPKLQRHTTAAHVAVKHGCGRSMAAAKDAAADVQQKPKQQSARGGGRSKH